VSHKGLDIEPQELYFLNGHGMEARGFSGSRKGGTGAGMRIRVIAGPHPDKP